MLKMEQIFEVLKQHFTEVTGFKNSQLMHMVAIAMEAAEEIPELKTGAEKQKAVLNAIRRVLKEVVTLESDQRYHLLQIVDTTVPETIALVARASKGDLSINSVQATKCCNPIIQILISCFQKKNPSNAPDKNRA